MVIVAIPTVTGRLLPRPRDSRVGAAAETVSLGVSRAIDPQRIQLQERGRHLHAHVRVRALTAAILRARKAHGRQMLSKRVGVVRHPDATQTRGLAARIEIFGGGLASVVKAHTRRSEPRPRSRRLRS